MRAAVLFAAAVITAVGCGSGSAATSARSETSLTITVWPEGRDQGTTSRLTLRCAPAGGTVVRPAATCRRLTAMSSPFAPTPKNVVCTDRYGGPQQAVVAGTYKGKRIWIQLTARDGCEIARWNRLAFLVPGAPGSSGGPA